MPPQCNDQIPPGIYTYYCEWYNQNGIWSNVNSNLPVGYYCANPPGIGSSAYSGTHSHLYLWPCPLSRASAYTGPYSLATYKFWNGAFHLVAARSQAGGTCPGNLVRYSENNSEFSFLVAFEFSAKPYVRGTYKFRQGAFIPLEGSSEDGSWPTDLVAYSKDNHDFSSLVTLEFFGEAMKSSRRAKKSSRKAAKPVRRTKKSKR